MNVIVVYKWGFDPEDAYLSSSDGFRWKRGRLAPSDEDAAAVASSKRLAADTGGTLTAVTIGNGDTAWAAARGAKSTFVAEALMPASDDAAQARELAAVIEAAGGADVIVTADAMEHAGVAPALAALLNMPYVGQLRDFEIDSADPAHLIGHRAVEGGLATIRFSTPALLSVEAVSSEKDVPSMKEMLAAKKAPVEKLEIAAEARSDLSVNEIRKAEVKMARLFEGDAATAATSLVEQLRSDGLL